MSNFEPKQIWPAAGFHLWFVQQWVWAMYPDLPKANAHFLPLLPLEYQSAMGVSSSCCCYTSCLCSQKAAHGYDNGKTICYNVSLLTLNSWVPSKDAKQRFNLDSRHFSLRHGGAIETKSRAMLRTAVFQNLSCFFCSIPSAFSYQYDQENVACFSFFYKNY